MTLDLQSGPQRAACASPAEIVVYGGQAGGGKTRLIVHKMAQMGYYHPGFQGAIFRRTSPEITGSGSIWEESEHVFSELDGFKPIYSSPRHWVRGKGAGTSLVEFRYLQYEHNKLEHQGKQYGGVCFDEATHFTEGMVFYLWGRCRGGPVPAFMILSCNPDPDSWIRDFIDWWIDPAGDPIPERDGVIRWFVRGPDGAITWADTPGALEPLCTGPDDKPTSATFIRSTLDDNPALLAKDPGYRSRLNRLLPYERRALADGNWNSRPVRGDYFQRGWFHMLAPTRLERRILNQVDLESKIVGVVRAWDLAATPILGDTVPGVPRPADFVARKGDADWTRGIKMGKLRGGGYVVLDMVSCRDTPGGVSELRKRTARDDGPTVVVSVPQDPGQAGIDQVEHIDTELRGLARVESQTRVHDKTVYAKPVSEAAYHGEIYVVEAPWNDAFFRELEDFPPEKPAAGAARKATPSHDDIVDALADAFRLLQGPMPAYNYEAVKDPTRRPNPRGGNKDLSWDRDDADNDIRSNAGFRRGGVF